MRTQILLIPICTLSTVAMDYRTASLIGLGANFEFGRKLTKNIFLRRSHDRTKNPKKDNSNNSKKSNTKKNKAKQQLETEEKEDNIKKNKKKNLFEKESNRNEKKHKKDKKSSKKLNKKQKKMIIKENKGQNNNKQDHKAMRMRKNCQGPLNPYRTCYERAVDPSNEVNEEDFILRNPFSQPFIDHDEWLVSDALHLELTQHAIEKRDQLRCKDMIAMEELSLKYLKDNIGGIDTFSPICSLISESAIKNEVVGDESGKVMQTIALKLEVIYVFNRQFAKEVESSRHLLRHNIPFSRNLASCNRGKYASCCSGKSFNSKGSKGSATCGGGGCGSSRCKKKKPKKKRPSRDLFESSNLPDLYEQEFDVVVDSYTQFEPEQTRGILEAKNTEDVAACAVNRFIEDVLNVPSMTCRKYREYNCIKNEDRIADVEDRACDSATPPSPTPCDDNDECTSDVWDAAKQTCVHTSIDCSSFSQYHQCDSSDGECKPICNDDGDKCTTVGWNQALNSCYTPAVCSNGETCDAAFGCPPPCDDNNKCTSDAWDYAEHTCVHASIDCGLLSKYHQCDPIDGECKPICVNDNNACTADAWNVKSSDCYTFVEICPDGKTECDPAFGCHCDDKNKCTADSWDPVTTTCRHEHTSCSVNESCDPTDGLCKNDENLVPCIAVIDEDNDRISRNTKEWIDFREEYPDRPFCLLIPYDSEDDDGVGIPNEALNDTKFQAFNVTRDCGHRLADDWFHICGLDKLGTSNVQFVGLFVDTSSSMVKRTVKNSYNKFIEDIASANLTACEVYDASENWIKPFKDTLTPESGICEKPSPVSTSGEEDC